MSAGEMVHPVWCDRNNCAERDEHRSRPYPANPEGNELLAVDVALVELLALPGDAIIAVVFTATPQEFDERLIELSQARVLARQLLRLTTLAGPQ